MKIVSKLILAMLIIIMCMFCIITVNKPKEVNITTNSQIDNKIINSVETSGEVHENNSGEIEATIDESINNIFVDSTMPYYIKVNRLQNVVNIYSLNEEGSYKPFKAMVCSIGKATPDSGESYEITTLKCRWSSLKGNVYGQYVTQIVDSILFHSVPYTKQSCDALEYWEYDKLGTAASLGCIRLTVEDAKWIYDNIEKGTTVEFYEDENPGPFGKPEAQKISDNEQCRNWDPTDISNDNPWNNI